MAVYSHTNDGVGSLQAIGSTANCLLQNNNTTTATRVLVQDILVGASTTASYTTTDTSITYEAARTTTTGTGGTAANGNPLDVTYRTPTSTGWANHTSHAGISTILLSLALNQRASQRWVAAPGSELVIPNTNNSGIGVFVKSGAYVSNALATMVFIE